MNPTAIIMLSLVTLLMLFLIVMIIVWIRVTIWAFKKPDFYCKTCYNDGYVGQVHQDKVGKYHTTELCPLYKHEKKGENQ